MTTTCKDGNNVKKEIPALSNEVFRAFVASMGCSEFSMTNFDHTIDDKLETDLRAGMHGHHNGLTFNGTVYYDEVEDLFYEIVYRFHVIVGIVANDNLQKLMEEVNDEYGWE
jgi:hypothetical protein